MKCPKCQVENPETVKFCGECGTALLPAKQAASMATETLQTPVQELTRGILFAGRFEVIEELGKGGMGKVYRVFDKKVEEEVALKLVKPEIAAERDIIERFSSELRLARKIRHKNVCGMYDLGEADGLHFITMEYVHGVDLKSMIRMSGSLSLGMLLSVGKQISDGLSEAHGLGIVHRDLKPQNIMIDKNGNAKIMDFGIARSILEEGITGPSILIGTPEYMSPEQAEAKEIDHQSDIYSLGIILYEMATSRVPFEGETALSIAMKHKTEIPKNPRQLNPGLPNDLSVVILKCLEKNKVNRYQSASELKTELERIEKGLPAAERIVPQRKPVTSREITVKFNLKKLLFPALPIVVLAIAAGIILWRTFPKKETAPVRSASPSIAVLPFVDDSPEKGHEYLCEGIPNTLINALNTVQNLRVPARTSAFSLVGKGLDIQGIGQKLNVENVLEGSIQVIGNSLRVTASLVKAKDGFQIWNATYDRQLEDVFAIQDDIAQAIVQALQIRVLGDRDEPIVKRGTEDMEAYKLYLEGLYYWNKRTEKNLYRAIELFRQAVDKDPNYALAYVGLADSYSLVSMYGGTPPQEVFPRARAAASKALEINETLAEAHNSLAYVYERYDWDFKSAEVEFKRSLELNPNYATGHFWYGELLVYLGRFEEGIREMKRAVELDPVSLVINENLGWAYLMAGQLDLALIQLRKTLEMDPNFPATHLMLGFVYLKKKEFNESITEMIKARELSADAPTVVISLGLAYAAAGMLEEARGILEDLGEISQKLYVSPFKTAEVYAVMGDLDRTFELLNKAYEERDEWMTTIKVSPSLVSLNSDPRYQAFLRKMRLE